MKLVIVAALALGLGFAPGRVSAQPPAPDPGRDNLVHEPGYTTAALGTLGAIVERGRGPADVVLVSGFGLGASAFAGFMERNALRYRMLAVTLPGFEGTPAPPMPAAGTSYGEQTWTRAAADAIVRLIRERALRRPLLIGHHLNGTQVAALVATGSGVPVGGLVLLAGSPRFEPVDAAAGWPQGLTLDKKVAMVDGGLAPKWFKTVTRETWVAGNFVAADYSVDAARGHELADRANAASLPVLIRYLCEFHASDVAPALAASDVPLLIVQPGFTAARRADPARRYLAAFFDEPWKALAGSRAERVTLEGAGIQVMDDQPQRVDEAIAAFAARVGTAAPAR